MDGAEWAEPTTKEHSMAGALRKTMVYLGLAEDQGRYDDDYDEAYDDHVEPPRARAGAR